MRKIFTLVLLSAFFAGLAYTASGQSPVPPKRYANFGYVFQNVDFEDAELSGTVGGKAEWGASFEMGTTYFLNPRRPIAGMVRLGIDFAYANLQYAQYKYDILGETVNHHYGQFGIEAGLSATVTPMRNLNLMAYVRYAPSMSAYFSEDGSNILGGYAGFIVGGVSVSLKAFTVGFQTMSAKSNYSDIKSAMDKITDIGSIGEDLFGDKQKVKLPSSRIYFGFRF